jgi:hypothetical protein
MSEESVTIQFEIEENDFGGLTMDYSLIDSTEDNPEDHSESLKDKIWDEFCLDLDSDFDESKLDGSDDSWVTKPQEK